MRTELGKANPTWNRQERLSDFNQWLHANGVDTAKFAISSFENYGLGLTATKPLAVTNVPGRRRLVCSGVSAGWRMFSHGANLAGDHHGCNHGLSGTCLVGDERSAAVVDAECRLGTVPAA